MNWYLYSLCEKKLSKHFPHDLIAVGENSNKRPCILTSGKVYEFTSLLDLVRFVWSVK